MSSVFFNGRLWTTPAVMSVVDDSAMYNRGIGVGNILALVGASEGGEPNKALRFGSPYEALDVLRAGPLLDAVLRAFDPSSETPGPSTIVALRVNPATRSTGALKDAGDETVVELASTDYGKYTRGIKVKVESGSTSGKKLTTQFGNAYYSQDNIYRDAFDLTYTGAEASATVTVTGSSLTLAAPAGTSVAVIDLTDYDTVQKLVDRINVVADFDANVLDGNGDRPALQGLDFVTAQSVMSTYVVTAHLQAVVDWFNGQAEGYVTATRPTGVGNVPANADWAYLSGGSDGTTTNSEWQAAFSALQAEDVQWVVPLSSNASIHAMASTHCGYMSVVARKERRCFVGIASNSTDDAAIAAAKNLNDDRTALVHLGMYDYDASGDLILYEPYILAAMIAGMFSGANPGTAMTNKSLKIRGLERKLRNPTDTDVLIPRGVLCVEDTATRGYRVVQSVSTWLNNRHYNRVEISTGAALDFVSRNVRQALEDMVGQKGNPATLRLAVEKTDSILRELARPEPAGPGVIVGDAENPAYRNITAEIEGDVLRVEFECSPVIPINFIPVTIHAVPWSGRITQA